MPDVGHWVRRIPASELAEWFGDELCIPSECEVCDSGKPVVAVTGPLEVLGACEVRRPARMLL